MTATRDGAAFLCRLQTEKSWTNLKSLKRETNLKKALYYESGFKMFEI